MLIFLYKEDKHVLGNLLSDKLTKIKVFAQDSWRTQLDIFLFVFLRGGFSCGRLAASNASLPEARGAAIPGLAGHIARPFEPTE